MHKQYAVELFDRYMREHSDARDLDPEQIEVVIDKHKRYDHTPANIDDVALVIQQEFPKENEMFRPGYRAPQQTKPQRPTQTRQEMHKVIADFLNTDWATCAPGTIPPIVDGKVASTVNRNLFDAELKAKTIYGTGARLVRRDVLSEIVVGLFAQGWLESPRIVERIVEVEKKVPLSPEELAKRNRELDRKMNAKDAPMFKTRGEQPKAATQEEILEAATQHANDDQAAKNVVAMIGEHRGRSRGATEAEKQILEGILSVGHESNVPWPTIEAQVSAKKAEMKTWDSTTAIRIVYAEAAAKKGVDLTKRTPNAFRPEVY